MVMAAAMKNTMSWNEGSGRKRNRSLLTAKSNTLSAPPARSAANTAMIDKPTTRMIIWKKSVTATDHMPPKSVYARIDAVPRIMPAGMLMTPAESRLKTSPSAVTWAATHPR